MGGTNISDGSRGSVSKFCVDFLAGGASAALARTIVAPIDRVKILLQVGNQTFGSSYFDLELFICCHNEMRGVSYKEM